MKLVVVIFALTVTSLTVFKTFVHGKMFNCKMTEEPTMATAEEAAQRVYAKKLAADRESKKRKRSEESQEQQENRLAAKERKTAQLDENPPGQRESKHIKTENDSDDDWVWDFDLDKVINAYQI